MKEIRHQDMELGGKVVRTEFKSQSSDCTCYLAIHFPCDNVNKIKHLCQETNL